MLHEQQQLIDSLKTQLYRLLKHQFGRRSEIIDVEQMALFADGSVVVEVPQAPSIAPRTDQDAAPRERRKAVRVATSLPRVIEVLDVPQCDRTC